MCELFNSEMWRPDPGLPWQLSHRSLPLVNTALFFSSFSLLYLSPFFLNGYNRTSPLFQNYLSLQTNTKPVVTKSYWLFARGGSAFSSARRCHFFLSVRCSCQLSGISNHFEPFLPAFLSTWYTYSQSCYSRHTEGQCGDCLYMTTRSHGNRWYRSFSVGWAEGKDVGAGTDIQEKKWWGILKR